MRHILVPLDGSGFGEIALPIAATIAGRNGSGLELVMVHLPSPHIDVSHEVAIDIEAGLRARAGEYLKGLAEQMRHRFDIPVATALLEGAIVPAIAKHTLADAPELIVMTTHGRSGPSRFFLGSVADRLVRELHCPVLLVRPGASPTNVELPAVAQVLVPLDGSRLAESVIDDVARVFSPTVATLHLVRVVLPVDVAPISLPTPLPPARPELLEHQLASARRYLDAMAVKLGQAGWRVQHEVAINWKPSAAVLDYAAAHRCDVIAIATRGLAGAPRVLLGSVADKVIRGAATPVLVVNPPKGGFSHVLSGASEAAGTEASVLAEGRI